jgi:hypothetical protein
MVSATILVSARTHCCYTSLSSTRLGLRKQTAARADSGVTNLDGFASIPVMAWTKSVVGDGVLGSREQRHRGLWRTPASLGAEKSN